MGVWETKAQKAGKRLLPLHRQPDVLVVRGEDAVAVRSVRNVKNVKNEIIDQFQRAQGLLVVKRFVDDISAR